MEKLTLYNLTKYYVARYGLPTDNRAGTPAHDDDGMGAYYTQIVRILKATHVGEMTLYDAIVPNDDSAKTKTGKPLKNPPRVISIEEFEKFCLKDFTDYIKGHYLNEMNKESISVLMADMDRWKLEHDREYWDKKAKEADQNEADALALGLYHPGEEDEKDEVGVTEKMVLDKGHDMMLEALFYKFYGDFEWSKLTRDMKFANTPSGAEINGDVLRCRYRLKSFLNYVVIDDKK